jgi:hypothetical protein
MEDKLKGLFGGGDADDAPAASAAEAAPKPPRRRRRRRRSPEEIAQAQDFINRYTTGNPSEGFSSEEAIGYLQQIRGEVPPEVLQRAAVQTVQNLPADQRKAFAEMLQRRQQGAGMVTIERTGQARAAEGRGGGEAGGLGMDDMLGGLFGSLLGGGMAPQEPEPRAMPRQAPQPQGQGGFGMDDMLGGLLGSLLGGGMAQQPQGRGAPASDPFGDLLGGMLGGGGLAAPEQAPQQRQQPQEQGGGIGDILGSPLGKAVMGGIAAYAMKEMLGGKGRKA